ncbi:MAG: septum site-determining protein MinC [Anaerolineae bacterium]|nr:MAG: septum site-determining protein MinC [Anaerolineae bacterium]
MRPTVQIKGIREGLLVTLGEGMWSDVQTALLQEVAEKASFFRGAKLILDVENHILNAATLGKLRDLLADFDLSLWAVLSHSPTTEQTAQMLGLATRIHQGKPEDSPEPANEAGLEGADGLLVRRTLRSGNSIDFPGHVTVIGDVNPGAEIIAGGDVVVWGRLRGLVHAGAEGDTSAVVCALDLSPTQLRIAGEIALTPPDRKQPRPEKAFLRDGQVVAEAWSLPGNEN